jgi:hypothetical protein
MSVLPPAPDPHPAAPKTLATTTLPRRVRRALEHLLNLASDELERHLGQAMSDLEQQLFRMSEQARNPALQAGYMQTLHTLRTNRSDLVPRFMSGLEASLAAVDRRGQVSSPDETQASPFQHLSLVDETVMDEDLVLHRIALRQESRASLTLHLLGQRFGVLAGAPAFDAERLPLGPRALCRIMRDASQCLHLPLESRLLLYSLFDHRVMGPYPQMLEMLNVSIAADGILPSLTYVPFRARPTPLGDAEAAAEAAIGAEKSRRKRSTDIPPDEVVGLPAAAATGAGTSGAAKAGRRSHGGGGSGGGKRRTAGDAPSTYTGWLGEAEADSRNVDENASFELLQHLLSGRRELLAKLRPERRAAQREELQTDDVLHALESMQATGPAGNKRKLVDIKQALLAQMRQQRGHGAALSPRDSDTFELLDMLYTQLEREVRADAPAAPLLRKLQVPMLRVALQDRGFFIRAQHPARQLLNAVAESGARWIEEGDVDPQMIEPLQKAVDDVVEHYDGDPTVFDASNRELQAQLHTLARKAETAERRHVEAARGKEKLEIAKRQAAETIASMVGDLNLPKFARALLNQAWADVLTLTLLRQGKDSDAWQRQLDVTRRIVAMCGRSGGPDPDLAGHIELSLVQVGYHAEEAAAIARRLTSVLDDEEDDPASRTELTMRLKARVRLGEDTLEKRKPELPPRTPAEQEQHDRLRVMPYGTWVEFVVNQQGDVVRRRMSWYSPVTDNALFVNQRGRRVGEQSLDSVARMLANGQARIVVADSGRLIDRAWHATLNTLRSFAGGSGENGSAGDGHKAEATRDR